MKNLMLFFFLTLSVSVFAQDQSDRFTAAMSGVIEQMENPNPMAIDWVAITNKLERIAKAEPAQWLPHYYLAYASLQMAMQEMNKGNAAAVEQLVTTSEQHLEAAKGLTEMNSELKCMEGYVYQGYIWIDPMNKGPQYAGPAHAAYAAAAAMDENNPRPHFLRGMLTLFTPDFFGGGAEKAMPLLEAAAERYEQEEKTERGIQPQWGQSTNQWMLQKANADLAAKE